MSDTRVLRVLFRALRRQACLASSLHDLLLLLPLLRRLSVLYLTFHHAHRTTRITTRTSSLATHKRKEKLTHRPAHRPSSAVRPRRRLRLVVGSLPRRSRMMLSSSAVVCLPSSTLAIAGVNVVYSQGPGGYVAAIKAAQKGLRVRSFP
jgi:hypothetical protein